MEQELVSTLLIASWCKENPIHLQIKLLWMRSSCISIAIASAMYRVVYLVLCKRCNQAENIAEE